MNKKIPLFSIVIILICLTGSSFLANVKADTTWSTETTGLTKLSQVRSNQNVWIQSGGYDIFCAVSQILFYDSLTGLYVKSLDVASLLGNPSLYDCKIRYLDEYKFLLVCAKVVTTSCYIYTYNVTISSLATTVLLNGNSFGVSGSTNSLSVNVVTESDNSIYVVGSASLTTSSTFSFVFWQKTLPTTGTIGSTQVGISSIPLSPIIVIPSVSSSYSYLIGAKNSSTDCNIVKIDYSIPNATYIGESGTVDTWSLNYIWYFGNTIDNLASGIHYKVGFIYPEATARTFAVGVLTFNDTYIAVTAQAYVATDTAPSTVRPLSVSTPMNQTLIDGQYTFNYINSLFSGQYQIGYYTLQITGLQDLLLPIITPEVDYGSQPVDYWYDAVANVGGMEFVGSSCFINFDYTNGKAIVGYFTITINSYQTTTYCSPYPVSPSTMTGIINTIQTSEIYFGTGYTLKTIVELMIAGYPQDGGNGNYTISTTPLSTDSNIANTGIYSPYVGTTNLYHGIINWNIPVTNNIGSYSNMYQGFKLVIFMNFLTQGNITVKFAFKFDNPATGAYNPDNGGVPTVDLSIFIVYFMAIIAPPLVLALEFSRHHQNPVIGFFGGLTLTMGVGFMTGLLPIWFLYLIIIVLSIFILEMIHKRSNP